MVAAVGTSGRAVGFDGDAAAIGNVRNGNKQQSSSVE